MTTTERYTYWMKDDSWSHFDEKNQKYVMADDAPEKAKLSFEYWKAHNHIK